jgi:hypothetical protein
MSHRVAVAVAACAALVLLAVPAHAQQLEMPRPSPAARVDQRVGLTDFQLEYSSPGVKNRPIWGSLVPYGKVWRTGANAATRLTVSRDFQIGNKKVKAGTYSLFTIPGKTSWTIVLNSDKAASTDQYKQAKDVARITVTPATMAEPRERLTFLFSGTTDDATSLDLEWERLRVRIPIKVDTKTQVMASIDRAVDNAWATHADAAEYLFENEGNLDRALSLVDQSIAIERTWFNHWLKAQILGKKGKRAEAIAAAQQAQTLGKSDKFYQAQFKARVDQAIASWR